MIEKLQRQLVLDLPVRTARGRDDFLVTPSNAAAVAMIDRFPDWPSYGAVLVGGPGSGKSHLLEVWSAASGATAVAAGEIGAMAPSALLSKGALAIDDAPGDRFDERALFHLFNLARQASAHILLASERHPVAWRIALPDLASRLRALPVAELDPPDDALLRGVLVKHFSDRQLTVDEAIVSYLMARMPRSLAAARTLVADADRLALEEKSAVTKPLLARVLQRLAAPDLFDDGP